LKQLLVIVDHAITIGLKEEHLGQRFQGHAERVVAVVAKGHPHQHSPHIRPHTSVYISQYSVVGFVEAPREVTELLPDSRWRRDSRFAEFL
jgi:hypothetical protein